MNGPALLLASVLLASALAAPVVAAPPGHVAHSSRVLTASAVDLKDGAGIADPYDKNSPCTFVLVGAAVGEPLHGRWQTDLRIGTNLEGPGTASSNFSPPLTPMPPGSWLPSSSGIPLGIPCPLPQSGPGALWLFWTGMNWRSVQDRTFAELDLCTLQYHPAGTPGCLPVYDGSLRLWVSACGDQAGPDATGNLAAVSLNSPDWATATFRRDYTDDKGKEAFGQPWDTLAMKNDRIVCPIRHSHDYTDTTLDFGPGHAGQTLRNIRNEAIVHAGHGTTYMVVCWQVDYLDFSAPLAPALLVAKAHDWKLVIDVNDPDVTFGYVAVPPGGLPPTILGGTALDAIAVHLGPRRTGDSGPSSFVGNTLGLPTVALRGVYSDSPTGAGENGAGPCVPAGPPETNKPLPLI